jgi:hypothetical protein
MRKYSAVGGAIATAQLPAESRSGVDIGVRSEGVRELGDHERSIRVGRSYRQHDRIALIGQLEAQERTAPRFGIPNLAELASDPLPRPESQLNGVGMAVNAQQRIGSDSTDQLEALSVRAGAQDADDWFSAHRSTSSHHRLIIG